MTIKARRIVLIGWAVLMTSGYAMSAEPYFRLIPDSIHFYAFNTVSNNWALTGVNYNYYSNGLNDSIITTNSNRIQIARTTNLYVGGYLSEVNSFVMGEGGWLPSQQQLLTYNSRELLNVRIVTKWISDHWENLNKFTYVYDESNRLEVYNREFWRVNSWTDFSNDSLFYNEDGFLTERRARLESTGQYYTRMLYYYSPTGLKIAQVRQDYINNTWVNINRTLYYYNECGIQIITETERWSEGSWQPDSRSEVFYHHEIIPGARKVPVCHNGSTIYVFVSALEGHLAHGDCIGECVEQGVINFPETDIPVSKSKQLPFVVYPNPARESISIRMLDVDCPVSKVELMDYYGRTLRFVSPEGQDLITLDLSALNSGNYILRLTSDTVYSTVVLKK